jgi:hypothetical protein
LIAGDNILEVETHQALSSAGDMVFGLSFTAAAQFPVFIENTNLPADMSVVSGQPVTFTSDVIGSGPLGYQWLKNGANITDATNASFTIPLVVNADAGSYSLVITNSTSKNTTRAAQLVVTGTPVVITDATQPADQFVVQGRPVTFNVVATGSAPVQYQWSFNATPIQDATNASYSIASVSLTNAGGYSVLVSNPVDSTNSRTALLTVLRDTIPPSVASISANPFQIIVVFSDSMDPASATNPANYTVSGGAAVTNAALSGNTVTLALNSGLTLGSVYTLTINGAMDLSGNVAHTTVSFSPTITIDGDMSDWAGIAPIYSGPSGTDGAADFKDIYMYNDASNYYFRVTLWHDIPPSAGQFPAYVNMFFTTDEDPNTGYSAIGSELLIQSGFSYQEKNGGFNEGAINGLNWLSLPATPGTNFEFKFSRTATFASDNTPVFPTNVLTFLFQGMNPSFVPLNTAASDGSTISFTNNVSAVVPALPLGQLAISPVPGRQVAVTWDAGGTLQYSGALLNNSWTNLPAATSPYVIPASVGQQFFRLAK